MLKQGSDIAILSLGTMLDVCLEVADKLEDIGVSVSLADARFAKPFDRGLVRNFATSHNALLLVEESSPGGFSAHILQFMASEALLDNGLKVRTTACQMNILTMPNGAASWRQRDLMWTVFSPLRASLSLAK